MDESTPTGGAWLAVWRALIRDVVQTEIRRALADLPFVGRYLPGANVRGPIPVASVPAHASTHQNAGADEINVGGLSGELADPQPPKAHEIVDHDATGGNEGDVPTVQADGSLALQAPSGGLPLPHASSHVSTGSDPIANAVAGGASGLMSGADKSKLDSLPSTIEHALVMGVAGTPPASPAADAADFLVIVPFNMTLTRLKATMETAPSADLTVQIRRSTDNGVTFGDFLGTVTVSNGAKVGTADPANSDVSEGDILNCSVTAGGNSGSNLAVFVIGQVR